MKLNIVAVGAFAIGALITSLPTPASAQPEDCEAARCLIQATIDAECPCAEAKNHGRYTSCVARVVNAASRAGTIPKKCRNKINACAIRSTCGKREGTVTCDFPGDGVSGRCRPLASAEVCENRGGAVVASCCETCGGPEPTATPEEPVATATPEEPVATATEGPVATATPEEPVPTATPEEPVATATEVPVATATPEEPVATATPEEPVATATAGPVATATPEEPVATATEGPVVTATPETPVPTPTEEPVATATEGPVATATPDEPIATSTPIPEPTSTPAGESCGNGTVGGTEQCDPPGQNGCATFGNGSGNGLEVCSLDCTCACPTRVQFSGDAADPASILDTGWTGIAHRAPIITNGDLTVGLANCDGTIRPCGTCDVLGPIANATAGNGTLDNQRCSHDSSIKCTEDGQCGTGNTCEFYFGGPLPLAAGGVTTCVFNQINGSITGTLNVESGEAVTTAFLTSRVYTGISIDSPCPRCSDAGGFNDGVNGGTCIGGTRNGLACDANGEVPGRPDFARTSLDCPLDASVLIATLPINLTNETNTVTRTLSAASPNCGPAAPGQKCMCQTCNNAASTPCFTNADCTAVGATICGGNRCVGGSNNGAVCTVTSQCPGGGACGRPGEPTKPSACLDNTVATPDPSTLDCVDGDGDGEGECIGGPITQSCSLASGHAQRGCTVDAECGGAAGSCESTNRLCFPTGGGTFQPDGPVGLDGTDTLIAIGMEDTPMNDVSNPTLGAVFCVGPTGSTSVNNVAGLPGPGRVTIKGTALGLP